MVIKELDFQIFAKWFKDNADLVVGFVYTESGNAVVLFDHTHHSWIVEREASGVVTISYSDDKGAWTKLGSLSVADFETITIC